MEDNDQPIADVFFKKKVAIFPLSIKSKCRSIQVFMIYG